MADERIIKHCAMGRIPEDMFSPIDMSDFWGGCPVPGADVENAAFQQFDDFTSLSVGDATAKWTLDHTNGGAILVSAEGAWGIGGVARLACDGTAEDFTNLKISSTDTGAPFRLLDAVTGRDLWFAVRLYISSVADISFYAGLFNQAETEVGADDTGARNMTDGIYFRTLNATPTEIDWACTQDSTETEVAGNIGTLAATTWITLGFKYTAASRTVLPYVNGTLVASPMSTANANFPDDQGLTSLIFVKEGAGAAKYLYVDWVKAVQKRVA